MPRPRMENRGSGSSWYSIKGLWGCPQGPSGRGTQGPVMPSGRQTPVGFHEDKRESSLKLRQERSRLESFMGKN